jgi:hypothetical protein
MFGRANISGNANEEDIAPDFPRAISSRKILQNFQIPVYRPRLIVTIALRNRA